MANETRFTGKAEIYATYRPSYPTPLLDLIMKQATERQLSIDECVVADIGAGTGKFTALLLEKGFNVIAVEPNQDMLTQLNKLKLQYPDKLSIQSASAEQTGLAKSSVDIIVCAQAFHWFDAKKAKVEWKSILKEEGQVFLIWNQRHIDGSTFMKQYEQLFLDLDGAKHVEQYNLYRNVGHQYMSVEQLSSFFGQRPELFQMEYEQKLDEKGLIGRIVSSSYALNEGDEGYDIFLEQIKQLFSRNEQDGYVSMLYETDCYFGMII